MKIHINKGNFRILLFDDYTFMSIQYRHLIIELQNQWGKQNSVNWISLFTDTYNGFYLYICILGFCFMIGYTK